MRTYIRLLAVVLFTLAAIASRADNLTIIWVNSAPSGSCTNGQPMEYVISTGILYSCQGGTWGQVGTGAGGPQTCNAALAPTYAEAVCQVNLTQAQVNALNTTPVAAISAPAPGMLIVPEPAKGSFWFISGFSGTSTIELQYPANPATVMAELIAGPP